MNQSTKHIDYIIEFLLGEKNKALCKYISYGECNSSKVIILPSGFFSDSVYLKHESLPTEPIQAIEGIPFLYGENRKEFKDGKIVLHADIIASTFFLISRYEECLNRKNRDTHGRIRARDTVAGKLFLDRCVVDEYGELLRRCLRETGVSVSEPDKRIKHIYLTHDVDNIWSWTPMEACKEFARRILKQKKNPLLPIKALFNYEKNDPSYSFPYIVRLEDDFKKTISTKCDVIYFLMGANKHTQYDFGYIKNHRRTRKLTSLINNHGIIGYHVSYFAKDHIEKQKEEINRVSALVGNEIHHSRNHYLANKNPEDFKVLIDNGITDDFTMGFAEKTGFRLGTCRAVRWINPQTKEVTNLVLHPLTVMECTLDRASYMNIKDEEEAFVIVKRLIDLIKNYNGEVVLLWHNQSFSDEGTYYNSLYLKVLDYLKALEK